jgi:hypothetical protein
MRVYYAACPAGRLGIQVDDSAGIGCVLAGVGQEMDEGQMTAPLRRAHVRIWVAAAAALVAIIAAALFERPDGPSANPVRWENLR